MSAHAIVGEIKCFRTEASEPRCACCHGRPHRYAEFLALRYESDLPRHFPRDINNWLHSLFDFERLEGKHVRITAELLDAGGPSAPVCEACYQRITGRESPKEWDQRNRAQEGPSAPEGDARKEGE